MSIANVLIRPQVLERRPSDDGAAALDMLTGLGSRLLVDFLRGGPASRKIADATQAGAAGFIAQFQPRLTATRTKLLDWLDPYLSILEGVTDGLGDDTAENLVAVGTALVALTDKLLDDLHSGNIAGRLNSLADILENDLGLGWDTFEAFFEDLFDAATGALSADFLAGSQSDEAVNNFLISRQLLSLRRVAKEQLALLPLPEFNRAALIRDWQLQLEASNWDETLDTIREKLTAGPAQLQQVLPLLTQSLSFSASSKSVRAAGVPGPGQYSWYASWFRGEGTGVTDRFDISAESFAAEIHFSDELSVKFLENWALITAALEEAARAVKYGFDLDNGNRVSPALNLGWQASMGVMTLLSYLVDGEEWVDFYSVKQNSAFQSGIPQALAFAGSFEQFPGFWGWLWATWPHDRGNASGGLTWPKLIREGFLSLFTLINSNDNANTKNHEKIAGFTNAARTGGAYIATLIMGRKERYYSIFSDNFGISVLVILGGGVITWAFDIIGWLIAGATARRLSDRYWKFESDTFGGGLGEFFGGENAYGSLFFSFIEFYGTWGGFWEGRTDDGKFGLKAVWQPDATLENREATFNGYPAKAHSPYRLPFEPGRLVFCPQGHNGFASHNFRKGNIYAADFLLNEGELALAMRAGTVVAFRDDLPNGADAGPNYIVIRHDELNADCDRGENGTVAQTFARYEHASPFGIRQAFALMGIPENKILGAKIQQGFPVIRVGKRPGFFNFDYLQVSVSSATTDGLLPTIPFVFYDIPEDGVPQTGAYYGSGNIPKMSFGFSQYHPGQSAGLVQESGVNFVKLQTTASDSDDAYKDAHLFVWYPLADETPWFEYQKIKTYDGGKRKATIEGNWLAGHPPPPSAHYRVGARPYGGASAFDKRFAYLADRDGAQQAIPFPDGHAVYLLGKTGYYHAPAVSGQLAGGGSKGANEVHLDGQASSVDHAYTFRHLIIRRNGAILQYRLIQDYRIEAGVRKLFIEGTWDVDLQTTGPADTYEIGAQPYWQAQPEKTRAFLAPDTQLDTNTPDKFRDNADFYRYHTVSL